MMLVPTIFKKDIKEYCEEVKDKIRTSVREDFINEGFEQFRQTLDLYHWCKTNDKWYGYEGADNIISELIGEGEY